MIIEFYFCALYQKRKIQFCRFKLWSPVCPFILTSSQSFQHHGPLAVFRRALMSNHCIVKNPDWGCVCGLRVHLSEEYCPRFISQSSDHFLLVSSLTVSYFKCKVPPLPTHTHLKPLSVRYSLFLNVISKSCYLHSSVTLPSWRVKSSRTPPVLPRVRTWPLRNKGRKRGLWT